MAKAKRRRRPAAKKQSIEKLTGTLLGVCNSHSDFMHKLDKRIDEVYKNMTSFSNAMDARGTQTSELSNSVSRLDHRLKYFDDRIVAIEKGNDETLSDTAAVLSRKLEELATALLKASSERLVQFDERLLSVEKCIRKLKKKSK